MLRVNCDGCGKEVRPGEDHHVVKIEVFAAADPAKLTEADLDEDHLETMAEMLAELEAREELDGPPPAPVPQRRSGEYDLCPSCYRKFAADPLGRERGRKPHFSKN